MISDETRPAVEKAREMFRVGIDIHSTGEATNAVVAGIEKERALWSVDADLLGIGVGLLLAGEGLDMPLAVLGIVDDPGLFRFTRSRFPGALADGHAARSLRRL
jgi:hypothetical protein